MAQNAALYTKICEIVYDICIILYKSVLWIRIGIYADPDQHFRSMQIRIQGFEDQKLNNLTAGERYVFLLQFK